MYALISAHPFYLTTYVIFLILLWLRKKINVGEFMSLLFEVAIVLMIASEIASATEQIDVLKDLGKTSSSTAQLMGQLQRNEQDSLGTLKDTLKTLSDQTQLLSKAQSSLAAQYDLAQREDKERNKRPVLQVKAILYDITTNKSISSQVLEPARLSAGDMNLLLDGDSGSLQANFIIRNVGTAEAVNVRVLPELGAGTKLRCVSYSGYLPGFAVGAAPQACNSEIGTVTILPYPEGRHAYPANPGSVTPDFDGAYDLMAQIHLYVEKGTELVSIVFTVSADGIVPQRYQMFGHNFYPDRVRLPVP